MFVGPEYGSSEYPAVQMGFTNASGLASVIATTEINCTIICTNYNESGNQIGAGIAVTNTATTNLPPGTTLVELYAAKTDLSSPATVNTMAYDFCGMGVPTDPSMASLVVSGTNAAQQRLGGIRAAAMTPGSANSVVLSSSGAAGASAFILLADDSSGAPLPLSGAPLLRAAPGAGGLALSWPDAPGQWQLQESGAPEEGWADVATAPAVANGLRSVTVSAGEAARFFRLRMGASGASLGAPPAAAGSTAATVMPPTNQPSPPTIQFNHDIAF